MAAEVPGSPHTYSRTRWCCATALPACGRASASAGVAMTPRGAGPPSRTAGSGCTWWRVGECDLVPRRRPTNTAIHQLLLISPLLAIGFTVICRVLTHYWTDVLCYRVCVSYCVSNIVIKVMSYTITFLFLAVAFPELNSTTVTNNCSSRQAKSNVHFSHVYWVLSELLYIPYNPY